MSAQTTDAAAPIIGLVLGTPDLADSMTARHRESLARAADGSSGITFVDGPCMRSDVLAQRLTTDLDASVVPEELRQHLAPQFLARPNGVAVLVTSLSAELICPVWRHAGSGLLIGVADDADRLHPRLATWLTEECEPVEALTATAIESNLRAIDAALRARDIAFVVCNVSTYTPGEDIRRFDPDTPETVSERIGKIDLLADHLARELELTLVDVDRLAAELGAGGEVKGIAEYSSRLAEIIGAELVAQIRDNPSLAPMFRSEVMRVTVPGYDRRTRSGEIVTWHQTAPTSFARGDLLFDLRFDHLQEERGLVPDGKRRTLSVSVLAGDEGFLHSVLAPAGTRVDVGQAAAIVTTSEDAEIGETHPAAEFPLGVRVITR